MICDYCMKRIRNFNKKYIIHKNVFQDKPKLVFCIQKCRQEWSKDAQSGIMRKKLTWKIKKRKTKYIFVRTSKKSKFLSENAAKMSYFSKNMDKNGYLPNRK